MIRRTIYKILSARDWEAAESAGVFRGTADDLRDGFIHFSAAHQVEGTLARYFAGKADLVLLAVRVEALETSADRTLRWEASRDGDRFPHLYGTLPLDAVHGVEPIPLDSGGRHLLPTLEP